MVHPDTLALFDHFQWLRTGQRASEKLQRHQSTISRAATRCEQVFDVKLVKESAEWIVSGNSELLDAERRVHQRWRWQKGHPLRFDCQHWLRDFYSSLVLGDWTTGNMNYLEYGRPRYLLRSSVIDAWLCSLPDAPDDADLHTFELCSMPTLLVAKQNHPLFLLGDSLTVDDAVRFPVLPLPAQAFPVFQDVFYGMGFSHSRELLSHGLLGDAMDAGLPVEDLYLGVASPLTLCTYESDWKPLPLVIPIAVGDALVVRSDYATHPRTRDLVSRLLSHLELKAGGVQDVRIVSMQPSLFTAHVP